MEQKNAKICYKDAGQYRMFNEAIKNLFEHNKFQSSTLSIVRGFKKWLSDHLLSVCNS